MHILAAVGHQIAQRIRETLLPASLSGHVAPPNACFMPKRGGIELPTCAVEVPKTANGYTRKVTIWVDATAKHQAGIEKALRTEIRGEGDAIKRRMVPLYISLAEGVSLWVRRPNSHHYKLVIVQEEIEVEKRLVVGWQAETDEVRW